LGFPTADASRELGVTFRRAGITAAECALGFRIATLMHRIGVKEYTFESFISDDRYAFTSLNRAYKGEESVSLQEIKRH
jgi:hypothetical protein